MVINFPFRQYTYFEVFDRLVAVQSSHLLTGNDLSRQWCYRKVGCRYFTGITFFSDYSDVLFENSYSKLWKRRLWEYSSTSGLLRLPEWWEENLTSEQGSSKERFPVGSQFSKLLFLDVPGTATEQVRTCGFRRNSSGFDSAPNIRDCVLLNSFESCVFCDWLILVFSGVSLETAASFLLFLNVAMIVSERFCQCWRLSWSFFL